MDWHPPHASLEAPPPTWSWQRLPHSPFSMPQEDSRAPAAPTRTHSTAHRGARIGRGPIACAYYDVQPCQNNVYSTVLRRFSVGGCSSKTNMTPRLLQALWLPCNGCAGVAKLPVAGRNVPWGAARTSNFSVHCARKPSGDAGPGRRRERKGLTPPPPRLGSGFTRAGCNQGRGQHARAANEAQAAPAAWWEVGVWWRQDQSPAPGAMPCPPPNHAACLPAGRPACPPACPPACCCCTRPPPPALSPEGPACGTRGSPHPRTARVSGGEGVSHHATPRRLAQPCPAPPPGPQLLGLVRS